MKRILLSVAIVAISSTLFAQTSKNSSSGELFNKNTKVLNVGVGLGSSWGLPISASLEFGITDKIGIAPYIGYSSYGVLSTYRVSNILLGAKGNYHFDVGVENLDLYGSLLIGYNVTSVNWPSSWLGPKINYNKAIWGLGVGGRYYFKPKIAGMLELGYTPVGYANLGVAFKL